jgi:hypothetical protein
VNAIVAESLASAHNLGTRLAWSYGRVSSFFPVRENAIQSLNEEAVERIDAFLFRFNSLFSMIQDHLFKGIAALEMEDVSDKSNKDRSNLMEKLGAIQSATGFTTMAELRNKLAHHYPFETKKQAERLNAAWQRCPELIAILNGLLAYVAAKKLIAGMIPLPPIPLK